MKTIRVVAAVIVDDKNRIYATQRGYGDFKGGWEFPGGKIESGETPSEAIKREIKEELGTEIEVCDTLGIVEFDYPKFHLSMDCFICHVTSGHLTLLEHMAAKWLDKDTIDSVAWLPADVMAVHWVKKYMTWL